MKALASKSLYWGGVGKTVESKNSRQTGRQAGKKEGTKEKVGKEKEKRFG